MAIAGKKWGPTRLPFAFQGVEGHFPDILALFGRRLILGTTGVVLVLAPLAYGAVHPWAYFTIGLLMSGLGLSLLFVRLTQAWAGPDEYWVLPYPPLWWFVAGLVCLILLQLAPWPQRLIQAGFPMTWELRTLGNGYALANYFPLSLKPFSTLLEGLKLWPALVLFFVLIYSVTTRGQIKGFVGIILAVGFFEVIYGFWNFHSHLIWGWKNIYTTNRLCGTFININHLATYLAMAILLGFGLFLAEGEKGPRPGANLSGWQRIRLWSWKEHLEPQFRRFVLLFLLILLTVGLIFTGSRGGMISLGMGFGLMALLIRSQRWRKGHLILIAIFLLVSLLYSLFLGSGPALGRFVDLDYETRYQVFTGALALFKEFPWLGTGLGSFGDVFYRYEPAQLNQGYYAYTHNDWLQLLAETGIVGFLLVAAAWCIFFSSLVRQWRLRRDTFARYLGLGGMGALGAAVFHSMTDFPFHIPAISLYFSCIAALTYLTVYAHKRGLEYFSYPTIKLPSHGKVVILVSLLLIGIELTYVFQVSRYWLAERSAPMEINSTRPFPRLKDKDFRQALAFNPRNSNYYSGLAETLERNGQRNGAVLSEVEESLRNAIFQSPAYWKYHLNLAEFYLRHHQRAPKSYLLIAEREMEAAVKLYPESGILHWRLATLLAMQDNYYSGSELATLREKRQFHFLQAVKIDPQIKRYFMP
jgi:O-antigen ligase